MRKLTLLLSLLLVSGIGISAQYAVFDESKVPAVADKEAQFAPPGWKIEHTARGDLNGDGRPDYAIKFVENKPVRELEGFDSERVLIIGFAEGKQIRRVAIAKKILQCTSCGGAFYGVMSAPANIEIQRGVLVIENEHGSRDVSNSTFRFRYDAAAGRFVLIGYDYLDHDRLTGEITSESTNYTTNVRVTKLSGKRKKVTTRRTSIKPLKIYLDDADGDEIEAQALHRLGLD